MPTRIVLREPPLPVPNDEEEPPEAGNRSRIVAYSARSGVENDESGENVQGAHRGAPDSGLDRRSGPGQYDGDVDGRTANVPKAHRFWLHPWRWMQGEEAPKDERNGGGNGEVDGGDDDVGLPSTSHRGRPLRRNPIRDYHANYSATTPTMKSLTDISASPRLIGYMYMAISGLVCAISAAQFKRVGMPGIDVLPGPLPERYPFREDRSESPSPMPSTIAMFPSENPSATFSSLAPLAASVDATATSDLESNSTTVTTAAAPTTSGSSNVNDDDRGSGLMFATNATNEMASINTTVTTAAAPTASNGGFLRWLQEEEVAPTIAAPTTNVASPSATPSASTLPSIAANDTASNITNATAAPMGATAAPTRTQTPTASPSASPFSSISPNATAAFGGDAFAATNATANATNNATFSPTATASPSVSPTVAANGTTNATTAPSLSPFLPGARPPLENTTSAAPSSSPTSRPSFMPTMAPTVILWLLAVEEWKMWGAIALPSFAALIGLIIIAIHFDKHCFPRTWYSIFRDGSTGERNVLLFLLALWVAILYVCTSTASVGFIQPNVYFSSWIGFLSVVLTVGLWKAGAGKPSYLNMIRHHPRQTTYNWVCLAVFSFSLTLIMIEVKYDRFKSGTLAEMKVEKTTDMEWLIILISPAVTAVVSVCSPLLSHWTCREGTRRWARVTWHVVEGVFLLCLTGLWAYILLEFTGVAGMVNRINNPYVFTWATFLCALLGLGTWFRQGSGLSSMIRS